MTTTASTRTRTAATCMPMFHLRQGVKLGGVEGSEAMLFPAAAFHDPQGQEEEEKRQREIKDHGPGINDAAGKIVQLPEQGEASEHAGAPIESLGQFIGQEGQQEQARREDQ